MIRANEQALDADAKREIRKCTEIIAKFNQQAPSPCRDQVSLVLNAKGVILNIWHVNSRVVKSAAAARNSTTEHTCLLEEFAEGALAGDCRRYLGQETYYKALELVKAGAKPTITGSSESEWSSADFPVV